MLGCLVAGMLAFMMINTEKKVNARDTHLMQHARLNVTAIFQSGFPLSTHFVSLRFDINSYGYVQFDWIRFDPCIRSM